MDYILKGKTLKKVSKINVVRGMVEQVTCSNIWRKTGCYNIILKDRNTRYIILVLSSRFVRLVSE
jgi:hypothetical protein